jgi:5-methylthioribose kinase
VSTESLDIERLEELLPYLRALGRIDADETPVVVPLKGGVSNRTVLVERASGERWVLKQALAKLRVDVEWHSDPARSSREALGIRHLSTLAPAGTITPLVFEDPDQHLLAMQAVPEPHENWKDVLMAGRIELNHVEQFGALLGTIHRRSIESAEPLSETFEDRSFFESLRLEPYYAYAATQVPEAAEFLERLIVATRGRRSALVHGDYSPKNILIHEGRLVLLDHEVIHWGDFAFDVGFALAHLLSKGHHFTARRLEFGQASWRFFEFYKAAMGPRWIEFLEGHCISHALGCLLARVAGRSKLEYLDERERQRQRTVVVEIMNNPPATIQSLLQQFFSGLDSHADR